MEARKERGSRGGGGEGCSSGLGTLNVSLALLGSVMIELEISK